MPLSAAEFLSTAELLPEPLALVRRDGRIEAANAAFAQAVAPQGSVLAGRSLGDFMLEPAGQIMPFLAAVGSERMLSGELTMRSNGKASAFHCEVVATARAADEPESDRHVLLRLIPRAGLTHVSTSVAGAENNSDAGMALVRERETLRVMLSSIGDAVMVTDAEGRITFMNPIAAALTGWSPEEAQGRQLAEVFRIYKEGSSELAEDPVARVLQAGDIVALANHTVLRRRDGIEVPIDDSAAPIRLGEGALAGVVLIFRDITQRRAAERTRNWLAAIIESSDDAVASKTLDGIITSWNEGARRLFGYSADEMIGEPIYKIIPPRLYEQEREILARLRAGQRIDHFDTVRLHKDGSPVDISLTVSPIRDASGRIIGASKVARDVTQRKRMEMDLREADRRKDEFLATLAHELRNPLAPIRTAADVLSHLELVGPARSAAEILQRQVAFMTRLVDELLDVARINSGRIELQHAPLDLRGVLTVAVESCRPEIDAARHDLQVRMPQDPVIVEGDRVRLAQVFANVLGNAAKYTPSGGSIALTLQVLDDDAVISVRDNGIGIDPHKLNYVFELFSQLDRSYERTGGGLGIGLALARRLVGMHEGTIQAHSRGAGKGSEFVVRLPLAQASAPLQDEARSQGSVLARRVLIADDNKDAAESLAMLIDAMGHETRVVYDGAEALRLAEDFRPDLMILDIGMPRLNGYDVARRLAQISWTRRSLLVALTGWGQQRDRQRALEAGFNDHLVKPTSLETLEGLFVRLAAHRKAQSES